MARLTILQDKRLHRNNWRLTVSQFVLGSALKRFLKMSAPLVAASPNYNLLVFRGTKLPQDWIEDLYCTPAPLIGFLTTRHPFGRFTLASATRSRTD
jgi:hypothetical protein